MPFESIQRFFRRGSESQAPDSSEQREESRQQPPLLPERMTIDEMVQIARQNQRAEEYLETHFISYDPKGPVSQNDRVRVWNDPDRAQSSAYADLGPPFDTGVTVWAHHPKSRDIDKYAVVETFEAYNAFHKANLDRVQSVQFDHGLDRAQKMFRAMQPVHEDMEAFFSAAKSIQNQVESQDEVRKHYPRWNL